MERVLGSIPAMGVVVEEKTPLQSMAPLSTGYPLASAPQPSSSHLALVSAQLCPVTSSSTIPKSVDFDEEIRRILGPLS